MGSPRFGLPALERLLAAGEELVLVVSQPDRPAGRARRPTTPPVAVFAREHGLPLHQPERLRTDEQLAPLRRARPDLIVVAAYGLILPSAVLDLPPLGCLNIHPSLLPRFRGASPVQAALLHGDAETGVTIIKLVQRMDAGPILAQWRTAIGPDESAAELEQRLAVLGAELLLEQLGPWRDGSLMAQPQDEASATYCERLERADARLDWSWPAERLARVVRAMRGRTDAFTTWNGRLLKVLRARPTAAPGGELGEVAASLEPPRRPVVATADGGLLLLEVALEGKAPTSGEAFLNGYPKLLGARLGPAAESPSAAPRA